MNLNEICLNFKKQFTDKERDKIKNFSELFLLLFSC